MKMRTCGSTQSLKYNEMTYVEQLPCNTIECLDVW